jgi:nucleoside-diphosphate-sugar epimerase
MLNKKIIIGLTGSTGNLGKNFTKIFKNKYKFIHYPHRIENKKNLEKWLKKNNQIEKFIHFAAISNKNIINKNKKNALKINYTSTVQLINFLNKCNNIKYFNFISSSNVYKNSNNTLIESSFRKSSNYYGFTKIKVENYIIKNAKKLNFKVGISRIFNYTSPDQTYGYLIPDIINKLKNNRNKKIVTFTNFNQKREFTHIDDVCLGVELMVKNNFEGPLNISSDNRISLKNLAQLIAKKMKLKIKIKTNTKTSSLISNTKQLKKLGYKPKKNIKNIINELEKKNFFN